MKPQALVWSQEVQSARMVFLVGGALVLRAILTPGPKVWFDRLTVAFLAVWAWFGLATLCSTHVDLSTEPFIQFCKIGIGVVLITGLVRTRKQFQWLMVLLALCPGIWGAKWGLSFVRGGGGVSTAEGPSGMDNNDMALFMAMGIPLLVFMASGVPWKWARMGMYLAAGLSVPGVIFTSSRGGLLAMATGVALTTWRKTNWWKAVVAGAISGIIVFAIIPAKTMERYQTIGTYEEDSSAMGRVYAWRTSMAMATDHPLTGIGIGVGTYLAEYNKYKVVPEDHPHVAHSVWFSLLGESGYIGLGLFVLLLGGVLVRTQRIIGKTKRRGDKHVGWAWNAAAAIQSSVLIFAVGGSFLNQSRLEFIYALFMAAVPLTHILRQEEAAPGLLTQADHAKTGVALVNVKLRA
jgi:probable O-glycosylation ligase (exosortase A-associated)